MPSLIAILGMDINPFNKGVDAAQGKARSAGKGIESAFGGLGKSLAGFATVGALTAGIHSVVEYGSKINDLSLRLGISTDAVQQWDFALKQNGSSIDSAVGFFEKLGVNRQKALAGNDEAIASFAKLGVTLDDLKNKRLEDVAAVIAKAFETGDPQKLVSALREVGGRGAGEMITAFRDGLAGALKEAPLISPEDIAAIDEVGDAWSRIKAQGMATGANILVQIGEVITTAIDYATLALSIGVGALMGAFESLSKMSLADVLTPFSAAVKLTQGAQEGSDEAYTAVKAQQTQRDLDKKAKDQAKKDRLDQAFTAGSLEEEIDKKAQKEADREAARTAKETDRLAAKEEAADAKADAKAAADAARQLEKDRKEGAAFGKHSVNAEQQLGAFFGNYASAGAATAPELAALNVQMQSEKHLAKIVKLLGGDSDSNQTSF